MKGNCKIYGSKLNYAVLVKRGILNFCGSIIRLLNYNCDQGWCEILWLPFCREVNQAQRGDEDLNVFCGCGHKDTHPPGSLVIDVCLVSPFQWCVYGLSHLRSDVRGAAAEVLVAITGSDL